MKRRTSKSFPIKAKSSLSTTHSDCLPIEEVLLLSDTSKVTAQYPYLPKYISFRFRNSSSSSTSPGLDSRKGKQSLPWCGWKRKCHRKVHPQCSSSNQRPEQTCRDFRLHPHRLLCLFTFGNNQGQEISHCGIEKIKFVSITVMGFLFKFSIEICFSEMQLVFVTRKFNWF